MIYKWKHHLYNQILVHFCLIVAPWDGNAKFCQSNQLNLARLPVSIMWLHTRGSIIIKLCLPLSARSHVSDFWFCMFSTNENLWNQLGRCDVERRKKVSRVCELSRSGCCRRPSIKQRPSMLQTRVSADPSHISGIGHFVFHSLRILCFLKSLTLFYWTTDRPPSTAMTYFLCLRWLVTCVFDASFTRIYILYSSFFLIPVLRSVDIQAFIKTNEAVETL